MNQVTNAFKVPYRLTENDQLCFVHLGKTGGSTLSHILEARFDPSEIIPRYGSVNDVLKFETMDAIHNSRLIRVHGSPQAIRELSGPKKQLFLTMLREPVDRTLSYYYFVRSLPTHAVYDYARRYDLDQFLELDVPFRNQWSNYQVRMLSDTMKSKSDINLARKVLHEEFIWIGLTEHYQESLDLLSYTFAWPPLVRYDKINVTKKRKVRDEIPETTLNKIIELNQHDIALYNEATALFWERYEQVKHTTRIVSSEYLRNLQTSRSEINDTFTELVSDHRDQLLRRIRK